MLSFNFSQSRIRKKVMKNAIAMWKSKDGKWRINEMAVFSEAESMEDVTCFISSSGRSVFTHLSRKIIPSHNVDGCAAQLEVRAVRLIEPSAISLLAVV